MKTILRIVLVSFFAITTFAREESSDASEFTIASASYGFADERIEVADLLSPLINHGIFLLRAPWGLGNPDPKPGTMKNVVIFYRHNGARKTATFNQHQDIILPPPPEGLTIISATYGLGNSRVDVTNAVRDAVANDALQLPAKWGFGRVDPAAGKVKTVEIIYTHDGAVETATFSQHQKIELP
ncbi:MAG: hypothetical protein JWR69_869 [Pedosphaera sp.]|nr:hypothetical protein [Pedosphaera sp.]